MPQPLGVSSMQFKKVLSPQQHIGVFNAHRSLYKSGHKVNGCVREGLALDPRWTDSECTSPKNID